MQLKTPAIVVNFKVYKESTGSSGLKLAKLCEEAAKETGASIAICPPMSELGYVARQIKIPCFAQHADALELGSATGFTPIEAVKESGASGTLINHSEHRLKIADIDFLVSKAKKLAIETIICTNNTSVSAAAAAFEPNFVAVEPPELIGSGISVSKAQPEIVKGSVEAVKRINKNVKVLCGAGITTGEDVRAALKLGADGVLLASGVVKAKDQKKAILELIAGLK